MTNPSTPVVIPEIALLSAYRDEIHWHCATIADRKKAVDEILASPNAARYRVGDEYLLVEPALLAVLTEIILAASNIKKLIKPNTERQGMTKVAHDHLVHRAQHLSNLVTGLPISEIYNADTRNALEHFDRELDRYSRQVEREKGARHKMALANITLSTRSALNFLEIDGETFKTEDFLFLRVYVVDTSTFIAFDEEVDIGKLCFEAQQIEQRLNELGGQGGQAGTMMLLPQFQKEK